jgi:hypothetical protein
MTAPPATVTIPQLPAGTTVSGTELFEAIQTTAGVANSVRLTLTQMVAGASGSLPTNGAAGQLLNKNSAANFDTVWSSLSSFIVASTGLTLSGSTTVTIAAALGSTQVVTSASYVILPTDTEVYVNRAGAVTLTAPDAASWLTGSGGIIGHPLVIKDISGAADSNNITLNRAGANTFDGATSLTITTKYGGWKLRVASANWAIVG